MLLGEQHNTETAHTVHTVEPTWVGCRAKVMAACVDENMFITMRIFHVFVF